MPADTVTVERGGATAWVVLGRPSRRNALDTAALVALAEAVRRLAAEPDVRVICLRGEGGHFSAGADIDELARIHDPDAARAHASLGQAACNALEQAPVPVIAAVRGFCVGGGLELALSSDLRLAHPDARFGQVELGIGSIAAWGGLRRLPRIVGVAAAKQLIYTLGHIDAATASRMGLLHRVVDDEEVEEAAETLAERLAKAPRLALAASKRALDHWSDVPLQAGLEQDRETFAQLVADQDFRAGVAAFLARSGRRADGRASGNP